MIFTVLCGINLGSKNLEQGYNYTQDFYEVWFDCCSKQKDYSIQSKNQSIEYEKQSFIQMNIFIILKYN